MEKDYIPFELALELKSLGFYEKCSKYFKNDGTQHPSTINYCYNFKTGDLVSSPLFSQVFRWFREKHKLNTWVTNYYDEEFHSNVDQMIHPKTLGVDSLRFNSGFTTYEEAELECLRKLIEIVKNK